MKIYYLTSEKAWGTLLSLYKFYVTLIKGINLIETFKWQNAKDNHVD